MLLRKSKERLWTQDFNVK